MPQQNTSIAIVTPDRVDVYRGQATHVIDQTRLNQGLQSIPEYSASNDLHLVIDGGHGNADASGAPQRLNNQTLMQIEAQIRTMKAKNLRFKSITLTPCFSAAFIPHFKELLTDDGAIFCQVLSSTASAADLLALASTQQHDVFSSYFACLECKFNHTRELCKKVLAHNQCFMSDAVYTKTNDTLHRFHFKNLGDALHAHNKLIHAGTLNDCKDELEASKNYLKTHGIRVMDEIIDPDHMEISVRENCFRFNLARMTASDLPAISRLEPTIFPNETPIDLNTYYHPDYSWVMQDTNTNPAGIAGYLFARPEPDGSLFIGNLGVMPQHQGRGIASKLLQQVIDQATEAQKRLRLQVRANNQGAIRLYKKFGFTETTSDGNWLTMSRVMTPEQIPEVQPSRENPVSPNGVDTPHYSFLLKLAVFSLGASLLLLATAFFPPLGLAGPLGIKAFIDVSAGAGYIISGTSMLAGASNLGLFTYMLEHKNTAPQPNDVPQPIMH